MKPTNLKWMAFGLMLSATTSFVSCKGKPDDAKILADFNEKARSEAKLANVSATVNGGVLTLNGQCPDEDCRKDAEEEAKEVKGVTSVINNIMIMQATTPTAPVEVSGDAALQQGLRDATKDYPGVTATVANGVVTLTGEIKRDKLTDLMQAVQNLNPQRVQNNLTIK
jgi:hyperosmotically inducible periplasmic protein